MGFFMDHFEAQESLNNLLSSIEDCDIRVSSNQSSLQIKMPDWPMFIVDRSVETLQRLRNAISDIEMKDGDDGRVTRSYPGIVQADEETLEYFCELNANKTNFKEEMKKLRQKNTKSHERYSRFLKTGEVEPRNERYQASLGRLSINHLYRQFCILKERPESISYSWSSKSASVVRITRKDAIRSIEALADNPPVHLSLQMDRLASLPANEILAKVIPHSASMKANIVFCDKTRRTVKPGLPILIPEGESSVRTKFLDDGVALSQQLRLGRSDRKIEKVPIASSIHVFRYTEEHRQQ